MYPAPFLISVSNTNMLSVKVAGMQFNQFIAHWLQIDVQPFMQSVLQTDMIKASAVAVSKEQHWLSITHSTSPLIKKHSLSHDSLCPSLPTLGLLIEMRVQQEKFVNITNPAKEITFGDSVYVNHLCHKEEKTFTSHIFGTNYYI